MKHLKTFFSLLILFSPIMARNIFLEFKGAYFLPTHDSFKDMYNKGRALYGPELTIQLWSESNWHAFMSLDYLKAHGHSFGLCDQTKVQLFPFAAGLKYFMPQCFECVDFYAGLGFQAMNVRTHQCAQGVKSNLAKWGFGGIAKVGSYYYLPHNFLIDIFVDYSFIRAGSNGWYCSNKVLQSIKTNIGGAIFGAALGYRF